MYTDLKSPDGTEFIHQGFASSSFNEAIENAGDIFKESDDPFVQACLQQKISFAY